MKTILSLIISVALVVSGYSQTRNVLVGTNNAVVQPTNFWSADASNARAGLGLGTAATNPASAFQPSSATLSNLASSNAINLTNIRATNLVGLIPSSNIPTTLTNITGTLPITQGGTGATNPSGARASLELGTAATNPSTAFQAASSALINLAANNGANLTNIPLSGVVNALASNGNAINLTNLTAANITGTVALASNITGTIAISNGGSGAITAGGARTNLGLDWSALTNTNTATSLLGFTTNGQIVANTGANVLTFTNSVYINGSVRILDGTNEAFEFPNDAEAEFSYAISFLNTNAAATTRTNLGLGATNEVTFGSVRSSGLFVSIGTNDYFYAADDMVEVYVPMTIYGTYGISFATNVAAAQTRTNLGLGATWLTNTNVTNFRTATGLGWSALTNTNAATSLLGFNTTNFSIVYNGGQPLVWTSSVGIIFSNEVNFRDAQANAVSVSGTGIAFGSTNTNPIATVFGFEDAGADVLRNIARTNLGLGWSALTNTNTSGFNTSLYGSGTNPVLVSTSGEVVSPTNFWQVAPIVTRFVEFDPATNATTNIVAARNLHIHSLAISRVGVTSTIALPITNSFNGDIALVAHKGPTSSVTAVRTAGAATNLVTMNQPEQTVEFVYYNNVWQFNHNRSFVEPIYFSGTNATANAAASRTNLGLGTTNDVTFSSLTLSSDLTFGSGDNIVLSTTNGTKIGTATNQLLGFYNQTPITQPSSTGVTTNGFTGNSGNNVHPQSTFTGGIGTNAYTISDVVAHLKSLGLLAP